MMTFSFSPTRRSILPSIEASVSTFVVSWNEAADRNDSVASDAFVIPRMSGSYDACSPFAFATLSFSRSSTTLSTSWPGSRAGSPLDSTRSFFSIAELTLGPELRRDDRHLEPTLVLLDFDAARGLGEDRRALRVARLEDLDHAREAVRDVGARDAAGVERPHRELRTRLAD